MGDLFHNLPPDPQDQIDQRRQADEDPDCCVDVVQCDCGAGANQGGTEVINCFDESAHFEWEGLNPLRSES